MEVKQVYQFVNKATSEVIGDSVLLQEDLSNVVDVGTAIFNANAVDHYVKSLVNHVGRVVFVDRVYRGHAPSVLMDSWEYGSVLEKISSVMPDAVENEDWELENGQSYDPNVFNGPTVNAKFFNRRITFEIDRSITDKQVKESFSNPTQLNAFVSMIFNEIDKSLTVKMDALIMRTIGNMIAETVYNSDSNHQYTGAGNARCINLLYAYNTAYGLTGNNVLTAAKALQSKDFLRFASYIIAITSDRMTDISTLFNEGGQARFTPKDLQHVVMLSEFTQACATFLDSDTFHNELVKLPGYETVNFWQGSGTGYSFNDTSKLYVTTADGHAVTATGILGCIFDRDALGVTNYETDVKTQYNAKASFTNYFYKRFAGYFNDFNENMVVFYIKDAA